MPAHAFCIPPNSTHMYQPLDVGYFKQLKGSGRKAVANFYDDIWRSKSITNHNFPPLLKEILENTDPKKNGERISTYWVIPIESGCGAGAQICAQSNFRRGRKFSCLDE
jgi:hypothetical protein